MNPLSSPLLTDLYQLTMLQAYFEAGMTGTAVFELFVRKLPSGRNFLVAAGLEQAVEFLEGLRFGDGLAWIRRAALQAGVRRAPRGLRSPATCTHAGGHGVLSR
jgi:nicotinic acid phosphoribosyltransferase